jgi:hypothetical protein
LLVVAEVEVLGTQAQVLVVLVELVVEEMVKEMEIMQMVMMD